MTNEQRNQVAAMNASGMTVDEIVIDTGIGKHEVEEFVKERNNKRRISAETKRAVIEWYQSGHTELMCAKKFGISPASAHRIITAVKEKEPTAAATAESSKDNIIQVQNTTSKPESQALKGVIMVSLLQTMLDEAYGKDAEIMSLKADSDTAYIAFKYGDTEYSVEFGRAF